MNFDCCWETTEPPADDVGGLAATGGLFAPRDPYYFLSAGLAFVY
jgi:hypothetical protein